MSALIGCHRPECRLKVISQRRSLIFEVVCRPQQFRFGMLLYLQFREFLWIAKTADKMFYTMSVKIYKDGNSNYHTKTLCPFNQRIPKHSSPKPITLHTVRLMSKIDPLQLLRTSTASGTVNTFPHSYFRGDRIATPGHRPLIQNYRHRRHRPPRASCRKLQNSLFPNERRQLLCTAVAISRRHPP